TQAYIDAVLKYVAFPYTSVQGVYTPESLYPLSGYNSQTLKDSVAQGLALLDTAIKAQTNAGNNVTVVGYSQSAIISSLEMNLLATQGNPNPGQLTFTLLGDPVKPNGGLLSRFAGDPMRLVNAIGDPIAATTGLWTFLGFWSLS